MVERFDPADLDKIETRALSDRANKVSIDVFARECDENVSFAEFVDSLPDTLAARSLRDLARAVVEARLGGRPVVWAMGAHPIKVGVSPVLIRLMERGMICALVLNGAGAIHDWEIAAIGATSEDVASGLDDGRFGMAEETGRALNDAAREAAESGRGLGEVLGRRIAESELPHKRFSLLAGAHRLGLPVTVHVAIGSDTVHMQPSADGGAIGAATFTDFKRLAGLVGQLAGGVWIHCGSAVQLPEVFLKALTVARNLGNAVRPITTANLDMQRHYRVEQNVLARPTTGGGVAFNLIGHHEINVPLLAGAILVERRRRGAARP